MHIKNTKFSIKNFPFFYGWIIVFTGAVGVIMSAPGQTIGISVFTEHLIRSFNLNRTQISLTYMFGTVLSSMFLPYAGKLYDKYGARYMAPVTAFILGSILFFLSQLDRVAGFISVNLGMPHFWPVFFLAIFAFGILRFSGQGVLTMISRNMVMKWFNKRRGLASSLLAISMSFGFSYAPKLFDSLIENNGWRMAWIILATIIGVGFAVFSWFFFRDDPKDFGLIPDGKIIEIKNKNKPVYQPKNDYTKAEALKTRSFWIFNLSFFLYSFYFTAISFHVIELFNNAGLDKSSAISIFMPSAVVAFFVQLFAGWLSDRVRLKYLLIIQLGGMAFSSIGLFLLKSNLTIWFIIIGNGIGIGIFGILSSLIWPRFYGTRFLGEITGLNMKWMQLGSAIAPVFFSVLMKTSMQLNIAALISFVLIMVMFVLAFKADNVNESNYN